MTYGDGCGDEPVILNYSDPHFLEQERRQTPPAHEILAALSDNVVEIWEDPSGYIQIELRLPPEILDDWSAAEAEGQMGI